MASNDTRVLLVRPDHHSLTECDWVSYDDVARSLPFYKSDNPYFVMSEIMKNAYGEGSHDVITSVFPHQLSDFDSAHMWIDEEGMLRHKPVNVIASLFASVATQSPGLLLFGPAVIAQRHISYEEDVDMVVPMNAQNMGQLNHLMHLPTFKDLKPLSDSINHRVYAHMN